jgi:hypothetical protein
MRIEEQLGPGSGQLEYQFIADKGVIFMTN